MTTELVSRARYTRAKRRHLRRRMAPGPPRVVFAMAKTGSSAIAAALREAGGGPVHHIHDLDPDFLAREEQEYHWSGRPWRIWDAQRLLATTKPATGPRWIVVSLVRDPIAQTVSAFFQPGTRRGYLHPDATQQELLQRFGDRLDHLPLRWFDRHLLPALGIDVFDTPFDLERRFQIIEGPTAQVLLLRSEDLAVAPAALASLLGTPHPMHVPRVNVGADKSYASLYERFRQSIRPTAEQLDRAYGSQLVRHFYSEGEIDRFRMVWSHEPHRERPPAPIPDEGGR